MLTLQHLVSYRLPGYWRQSDEISVNFSYTVLEKDREIDRLFRSDKGKRKVFTQFVLQGFIGIVWYKSNEWISYAWMSTPETFGPPHLPRWIKRLPIYWIFYCRTKEQYQGRGLYKASLNLLAQWVRERNPSAQIYIDTSPDNIPSRKAIESVGFVPAGTISILNLRLPKISLVLWGKWDKRALHPEIPKKSYQ